MRNWCLQCFECSRTVCNRVIRGNISSCIVPVRPVSFFVILLRGRVMSEPFRFDVTDGFSRKIVTEYDGSLTDSDSMGHEGVIKCNIVTNVVRMCLRP